jgi:hypothetical protein
MYTLVGFDLTTHSSCLLVPSTLLVPNTCERKPRNQNRDRACHPELKAEKRKATDWKTERCRLLRAKGKICEWICEFSWPPPITLPRWPLMYLHRNDRWSMTCTLNLWSQNQNVKSAICVREKGLKKISAKEDTTDYTGERLAGEPGVPDFCWYVTPKPEKCTKSTQNLRNGQKFPRCP